jgi:DNA-binding HxlR family transcriptional regulator
VACSKQVVRDRRRPPAFPPTLADRRERQFGTQTVCGIETELDGRAGSGQSAAARFRILAPELGVVEGKTMSVIRRKLFCPLAMASDILCTRWTMMLLSEMLQGTTRFNDLRRGLPRMSPALLSKRLKELEAAGVVTRRHAEDAPDQSDYVLTEAGRALEPIVDAMGEWGHRWVTTEATLAHLDVKLLMWNLRRNINPDPMPPRRCVIQIAYRDLPPPERKWWLLVEPGIDVDLCSIDPGYDVDLHISTDLRTMTELWMGYAPIADAIDDGSLMLVGDRQLETSFPTWLGSSGFAGMEKCVA